MGIHVSIVSMIIGQKYNDKIRKDEAETNDRFLASYQILAYIAKILHGSPFSKYTNSIIYNIDLVVYE